MQPSTGEFDLSLPKDFIIGQPAERDFKVKIRVKYLHITNEIDPICLSINAPLIWLKEIDFSNPDLDKYILSACENNYESGL